MLLAAIVHELFKATAAPHSLMSEHMRPARLPMMPPALSLMFLCNCEHAWSLFVAGESFHCLQALKAASPTVNLSVMALVEATTDCMACTQAWHFWHGVSTTTGGAGAGRGWQVLMVLHES
jgi:hypothetical protein